LKLKVKDWLASSAIVITTGKAKHMASFETSYEKIIEEKARAPSAATVTMTARECKEISKQPDIVLVSYTSIHPPKMSLRCLLNPG
jgi:hypothetical protein